MQAFRRIADNRHDIQNRAIEEHLRIIGALLKKDDVQAADAMSRHIASTARGVEHVMFPPEEGGNGDGGRDGVR